MNQEYHTMNEFLVGIFHEILKTEEASLRTKEFKNLSMREMHIIEAVCQAEKTKKNTASQIANAQRVTSGTLATAMNTLEKKGYVKRVQDACDKRVVRIFATDKGKAANQMHADFHHEMVSNIISCMTEEELAIFLKGLASVHNFFKDRQD